MKSFLGRTATSAILFALAALCILWLLAIAEDARELDQRSKIEAPAERFIQGSQDLAQALHHLHQAGASDNHLRIETKMFIADRDHWKRHAANIAAQRGWYAHSLQENPMRMIVPERERETLAGIEGDPYGWLEQMRSNGPAIPPSLGQNPVHVSVRAEDMDSAANLKYGLTALPIGLGISLTVLALTVLPVGRRAQPTRRETA